MFVRKRRNKSGTTSVVIVDKSSGRFKELATIGVASSPKEISELEKKARRWMDRYGGQQSLDFEETAKALEEVHKTLSMVERTLQNAPQVILERVYERIGFNAVGAKPASGSRLNTSSALPAAAAKLRARFATAAPVFLKVMP